MTVVDSGRSILFPYQQCTGLLANLFFNEKHTKTGKICVAFEFIRALYLRFCLMDLLNIYLASLQC